MLTHVQIIQVPVSDQDRAKDFYVDMLGLSVVADMQMGPHGRWLQVAPAGAATSLAIVPGHTVAPPGSATVVFESDDIEADAQALRARGVDLPEQVEQMPWATTVRFTDPDGNDLALQTPTAAPG
ncbi:glyoxalase superfamily protein [Lipingzhangella sp. LS1_29]|uniref:Glyoxalase superfamily protein n=1 Tax=Lipingzhangella rawalii TaxID=2055835 RepID=A0ABU2HC14_9ACTN|nr:glyoxalase superfamily protein [Lipingzhangella rawalii]MDS1272345.1 glyoxalase superfamily protein [Lipingzhangella rawalii]